MKQGKELYSASMVYDEATIQRVFKAEYYTYERLKLVIRGLIGLVLILLAVFGHLSTWLMVICLAIGCWLLVAMDFPSKVKAEGVIEARHGVVSRVTLRFYENDVLIVEAKQNLPYKKLDRLVEENDYIYLFWNRQQAVAFRKDSLRGGKVLDFKDFIAQKSGKKWQGMSLLLMNFKDLRQAIKDRFSK